VEVDGVYTNKPPGGIAYRCSFRVTEAVHTIERMVDLMAHQLGVDAADFRMKNFIRPEQFPYKSALGWEYDSGNYAGALQLAMKRIGYAELRREQAEKRKRGELMGIGISSFTEIVGAGPSKHFDILGLKMFDSCEIRIHPRGKATRRPMLRSLPRSWAFRRRTSRSRRATPTRRPMASAPMRVAPRPSPAPPPPWPRARSRTRRGRSPPISSRPPPTTSCGSRA